MLPEEGQAMMAKILFMIFATLTLFITRVKAQDLTYISSKTAPCSSISNLTTIK